MKKNIRIAAPILIMLVGLWLLAGLRAGHLWADDFALYIMETQNILSGITLRQTGYIYNPNISDIGPLTYPPIFPILMAPVIILFGLSLTALKIELVFCFILFLWILYKTYINEIGNTSTAMLLAIVGFSPYIWDFKDNIASDIPFMLFAYVSLLLISKQTRSESPTLLLYVITALTMYCAYGTRSVGIILLPCIIINDLFKNRKIRLSAIITSLLFIFAVIMQTVFLHNDAAYSNQLQFHYNFIFQNSIAYMRAMGEFWINGYSKNLRLVVFALISIAAIIGFSTQINNIYQSFKQNVRLNICYELFFAGYLTLIIAVPIPADIRYLLPVFPLYIVYALRGFRSLFEYKPVLAPALLMTIIVCVYIGRYSKLNFKALSEGVEKRESIELFNYIKDRTKEEDIFLFRKPRALALYTERHAAWQPANDPQTFQKYIGSIKVTYIVTGPNNFELETQAHLTRYIASQSNKFIETFRNKDFTVYKILYTDDLAPD